MTEPTAPDPGASAPPPPQPQSSWPPPQQTPPSWAPPPLEPGPAPGVRFASHGPRLLAYIIDGLIVGVVLIAVIVLLSILVFGGSWMAGLRNEDFQNMSPAAVGTIVSFVLLVTSLSLASFLYFPFFWARSGQTPGMKLFGLYVVRDTDGGKISGGQAILRLFGYWVSAFVFYLGFIWILIDARRRGWHDLIAGTVVVERVPEG
jgi:uncharacterized RDD family membrane protein YckC